MAQLAVSELVMTANGAPAGSVNMAMGHAAEREDVEGREPEGPVRLFHRRGRGVRVV